MSNLTLNLAPALKAHRERDVDLCLEEVAPILKAVPHHPVALQIKAWAISKLGRFQEALQILAEVIDRDPMQVPARVEFGSILMANHHHAEALQHLKEAHRLQPNQDEVIVNFCVCLIRMHRSAEAEPLLREFLERSPGDVMGRLALANSLLQQGKWIEGFSQYRIRFWLPCLDPDLFLDEATLWNGELLGGKTLLIQTEQSYSDQILFARYARWVKEAFGPEKIVISAKPEMKRLLEAVKGIDEVVTSPLEVDFDYQIPLLNLPKLHKTTPGSIPFARDAYIWPDDGCFEKWESLFDTDEDVIGVCWRTNLISHEESQVIDHEKASKSMDCDQAAILCQQLRLMFPEARIISLQPGATEDERTMLAKNDVEDIWRYPIADFADTAGAIEHMDLVVSTDTAVAHLAGALARPVWNLLPYYSDWKWAHDNDYSSWYPDMRLFRQESENNWDSLDVDQ
jgi:tetratricopeptide (TPR) repeat protein